MKTAIVIPARYASSRLPGKPLADILGKPMIQHVYERALEVSNADEVIIATDDARIIEAVKGFGGKVVLTSDEHESGSDRLIEVLQSTDAQLLVNIQGDEPLIRPTDIESLISMMHASHDVQVGTLCHLIDSQEADDPNMVKVVMADNGDALYFSRSKIPFDRDGDTPDVEYFKHVGVYAYQRHVLENYGKIVRPALEKLEKLEQLRFLTSGIKLRVIKVEPTGPGVDTSEGLEIVRKLMSGQKVDVKKTIAQRLAEIKLIIVDVDGVLTDGTIFYGAEGEIFKNFYARDGLGMRMLEDLGVRVAVVSGKNSAALQARVKDLKLSAGHFGIKNKFETVQMLQKQFNATQEQTACIGDDSIDLPAFKASGVVFVVNDAEDYVKKHADVVLKHNGGKGAVREMTDAIMRAQGYADVIESAEGYKKVMNNVVQ